VRDLAALTAADFEPLVGTDFQVSGADVPGPDASAPPAPVLVIRLVEVQLLRERPGHRQPFALRFTGPASPVLAQQIQRLSHAEMGELEFFLGPVVSDAPGVTYEAVFN
jgi:hypothetical protein